jgi:hypothetical protein
MKTKLIKKQTEKLTCIVCKSEFTDSWKHILKSSTYGISQIKNKPHQDYVDSIVACGYDKPCFCGGKIGTFGSEDRYEVRCTNCDFLYDED